MLPLTGGKPKGCNVPLAFPDSKIAAKYHFASTKAMCMLKLAVAPSLKQQLIDNMKIHPFSVSVNGSNDNGLEKIHPLTIRIYDVSSGKIVTQFLDLCT